MTETAAGAAVATDRYGGPPPAPARRCALRAVALAVGFAPEMLPAIVAVTLARGAREMAALGVIVKRPNAIESFGSMDVLCTDKTGTLTEGVVRLSDTPDPAGRPNARVRPPAPLNPAPPASPTHTPTTDTPTRSFFASVRVGHEPALRLTFIRQPTISPGLRAAITSKRQQAAAVQRAFDSA